MGYSVYMTRRRLLGVAVIGWSGLVGATERVLGQTNAIHAAGENSSQAFIQRAFEMRDLAVNMGDQSYGAVIVDRSGNIVGEAPSRVVVRGDPTAHAEMEAIRDAARRLNRRDLSGHALYSSARPCPMCEAAAAWANISAMFYGADGRNAGRPELCR